MRAGLDIVASIGALNAETGASRGVHLAVRVGIATGLVVVGDIVGEGASAESAVVGDTPNLAARLQSVAAADQVVIGAGTRALLGDRFDCEDLGGQSLKGIDEPVPAWRVAGERGEAAGRAARAAGAQPLVGRQEELGLLLRAWDTAREGLGQVVLVLGEPGIGKSRLVEASMFRTTCGCRSVARPTTPRAPSTRWWSTSSGPSAGAARTAPTSAWPSSRRPCRATACPSPKQCPCTRRFCPCPYRRAATRRSR